MRRSWPADVAALVRVPNLVLAALGVLIGGVLAAGRLATSASLTWAALSALGLGAAGNAVNDLFDLEADRLNRPGRPLVRGDLSHDEALTLAGVAGGLGLALAWWAGRLVFALAVVALVVMVAYSPLLKSRGWVGNVTVAAVASLPLAYGAAAAGDWRAGLVPFALAALLHLTREVVKDLEDVPGDRLIGRRTIPIVWGETAGYQAATATLIVFVPASLAPWVWGLYDIGYGLVVVALDLGLVYLAMRLARRRLAGVRTGLKLAMAVGLAALLLGRL